MKIQPDELLELERECKKSFLTRLNEELQKPSTSSADYLPCMRLLYGRELMQGIDAQPHFGERFNTFSSASINHSFNQ